MRRWQRVVLSWIALVVSVAALLTLAGYPIPALLMAWWIDVDRIGPAKRILVYEEGRPILERPILPDSPAERSVSAWLKSHSIGWCPTLVYRVPDRLVQGDNFELNFGRSQCVLNYRVNDRGNWIQVSRSIKEGDIPDVFAGDQAQGDPHPGRKR